MRSEHENHDHVDEVEEVERHREDDMVADESREQRVDNGEGEETARDAWEQGPGQDPLTAARL